jgi:tRNA threonylcarbamoyladenosine biosynthesis protein TsaE
LQVAGNSVTTLSIPTDPEMRQLGARLAHACPLRCIIYLLGELGAGKSTLARGFLHALGHEGPVRSPTYTLVETYELAQRQIYHLDLYRLADPEELEFLGLRDWLEQDAILLVEWPQKGAGVLPGADLIVDINYAGTSRDVSLTPISESGKQVIANMPDLANN